MTISAWSSLLRIVRARPGWTVWCAFLLTRLGAVAIGVIFFARFLEASDTRGIYYPIAQTLAAGDGYRLLESHYTATRVAPLFPVWLAFWVSLCGGPPPLWLSGCCNAVFRATAALLAFRICERYFGRRAAGGAAFLYLVDPWEALWVGYVLKESLALPLFLLGIWMLSRMLDRPVPPQAFLAGAAIGLATLARYPNGSLWLSALLIVGHLSRRAGGSVTSRLRQAGVLAGCVTAGMLLSLSPWLIRNWRVTGYPVLSTEFIGRYFYTSNQLGKVHETGGYADGQGLDFDLIMATERKRQVLESETSMLALTLKGLARRPTDFLLRIGAKLVNMWRPTFGVASLRNSLMLGAPYVLLMALSLAGMWIARQQRLPCAPIIVPLMVLFLIHLVFWAEIRNRQYLTPLLYCFGGLFLAQYRGIASRQPAPQDGSRVPGPGSVG